MQTILIPILFGSMFYVISTYSNPTNIMKKCNYTRELFASPPNTCGIRPNIYYKNIYEKSYLMELWEFNEAKCEISNPLFKIVLYVVVVSFVYTVSRFP